MLPLLLSGIVIRGEKRGRTLGFPTANIDVAKQVPDGVYASLIWVDGLCQQAVTFVGAAETFGRLQRRVEIHILDFDEDIYDMTVRLKLLALIRLPKKFGHADALVAQIKKDIRTTRLLCHGCLDPRK